MCVCVRERERETIITKWLSYNLHKRRGEDRFIAIFGMCVSFPFLAKRNNFCYAYYIYHNYPIIHVMVVKLFLGKNILQHRRTFVYSNNTTIIITLCKSTLISVLFQKSLKKLFLFQINSKNNNNNNS